MLKICRIFGTICGGLCPPRIRRVLRRIRLCPRMSAYVRPTVRRGRCPRRTKKSAADSAAESANPRGSERIRRGLWRIRRGLADSPPRTAPEKVRRGLCPPHDVIRTIYAADNVRRERCPPRTKVRRAQCPPRTQAAAGGQRRTMYAADSVPCVGPKIDFRQITPKELWMPNFPPGEV